MQGHTTQKVANQFVTSPKLCPALTPSASTSSGIIKKGIGPSPNENPATKANEAITETNRHSYTIPNPKIKLETPIDEILHNSKGRRPEWSTREAAGIVVARFTSEIMREIRALEEGRMDVRIEVE